MSKKGGVGLQKDAPWRASQGKPIPKIHRSPLLRVPQNPFSDYALSVMRVLYYLLSFPFTFWVFYGIFKDVFLSQFI